MAKGKKSEPAGVSQGDAVSSGLDDILGKGAAMREMVYATVLGILIFLRPWYDGLTFPETNFTFLWGYVILAALLASRLIFARESIRFVVPTGIFAAFVFIACVLSPFSVQKDATFQGLVILTGHLLLFFVAVNGIRTRRAVAIVLGFFVVSSVAETLWAYLHVTYLMPATRQMIAADPSALAREFGTTEMTADIKSRLESNRATGSLLFANALACWVLTGIPVAVGAAASAFVRLRTAVSTTAETSSSKDARESKGGELSSAGVVGMVTVVLTFLALYCYFTFYWGFAYPGQGLLSHPIRAVVYCLAAPIALGWCAVVVCRRHGLSRWLLYVACGGMGLFALLQVFGLVITYSRGGMLASLVSLALLAWLAAGAKIPGKGKARVAVRTAIVLVGLCVIAVGAFSAVVPTSATAQDTPVVLKPQGGPVSPASLELKGENPSRAQLLNPATALLRFSYWGSGIRMAADNFLTGVGLGNFGTVYPLYQYLGAGDVQQAHNDFLQTLCETGILGFALFTAFWVYFFVWGVRRIRATADKAERWLLAGLFSSVIAFVLHSVVDFNFSNPSLTALVYLMAGLFYARASKPVEAEVSKRVSPFAGIAVLMAGGIAAGLGYQATMPERLVGDERACKARLEAVKFICERAEALAGKPKQNVAMPDGMAKMLFPDQSDREQIGKLYERTSPTSERMRPLAPGETPPPNTYLVFNDIEVTHKKTMERVPLIVEQIKEADGAWPYNPKMASHIWLWYDLLYGESSSPEEKLKYADACLDWAHECVRRSPKQVPYSNLLGRSLWRRGAVETSVKQIRYYDQGLEEFRHALELYPEGPLVYFELASRLREYGTQLDKAGDHERGQAMLKESVVVQKKAEDMQAEAARRIMERNAG
ncbi:MAG: O-antigen ligase family protein [Candidatus Hydrogenedentes bacterium]|nr:O-antigen ligase family protein [Candidatus Hydrogenedentota bacterium]